jgi:hypothetical protein
MTTTKKTVAKKAVTKKAVTKKAVTKKAVTRKGDKKSSPIVTKKIKSPEAIANYKAMKSEESIAHAKSREVDTAKLKSVKVVADRKAIADLLSYDPRGTNRVIATDVYKAMRTILIDTFKVDADALHALVQAGLPRDKNGVIKSRQKVRHAIMRAELMRVLKLAEKDIAPIAAAEEEAAA